MAEGSPDMPPSRLAVLSWCLYDWANTAFSTVITTFVFATYFTQAVAQDPLLGTTQWGQTLSLSAFVIALASPVMGAIADKGGRRKPWLLACTAICVVATGFMWFVKPSTDYTTMALVLFFTSSTAYGLGTVFYDASIAPRPSVGLGLGAEIRRWIGLLARHIDGFRAGGGTLACP